MALKLVKASQKAFNPLNSLSPLLTSNHATRPLFFLLSLSSSASPASSLSLSFYRVHGPCCLAVSYCQSATRANQACSKRPETVGPNFLVAQTSGLGSDKARAKAVALSALERRL